MQKRKRFTQGLRAFEIPIPSQVQTGLPMALGGHLFLHYPMQIDTYTGGLFDTNCFFLPEGGILFDAPQGSAEWLAEQGHAVKHLLITHGHIDHVAEAAQIKAAHGCRVGYHADNLPMLTEPGFFRRLGFGWEIEPVAADFLVEESPSLEVGGVEFQTLLVPGHCPGSICFLASKERILFGGDVLFAGGVGRWDLPGGDRDLLLSGIRGKLFPLGDEVKVLPGHGPATTIGHERKTNPYVQG